MLVETNAGLFCPEGDFHIDPWRPVDRAIVTHAHGDHVAWGSKAYLTASIGSTLLAERLAPHSSVTPLEYGAPVTLNGVKVSLHPAGHILGSSQVRIERGGEVVLGDLMHAKAWKARQTHAAITQWRQAHSRLPIILVRGNHDLRAGDPTPDLGIEACSEPLVLEGLQLCHHPCTRDEGYTLAGHVHPCYTLFGPARQRERLPCFFFGPRTGLIPAFGSFTGMAPVDPLPGDRLFLVAGDDIVALPHE